MAEQNNYISDDEEEEVKIEMCPMDGCENEKNFKNKKGRCDRCHKWWDESKRIFFGLERRCQTCKELFFPESRDATRDKEGYVCGMC